MSLNIPDQRKTLPNVLVMYEKTRISNSQTMNTFSVKSKNMVSFFTFFLNKIGHICDYC